MLNQEEQKRLENIISEIVTQNDCILYDMELCGSGNNRILRIYIDKYDKYIDKIDKIDKKTANVTLSDCERVSKSLSLLLDVEDIIPGGSYKLEVSSPGIERVLKKIWHFEKVIGKEISLKCNKKGQSNNKEQKKDIKYNVKIEAILVDVKNDDLHLKIKDKEEVIHFADVSQAKVLYRK